MPELESIELLRYAVRMFDGCRESFNQTYDAHDLLKLARVMRRCEWDITPDGWSPAQLRDAICLGKVPTWVQDATGDYVPSK